MQRIPPELTANARSLRTGTTEAERKLWHLLRHHRPRFTRQLVVDRFIIDIACRSLKVAIELDGGHHSEQIERDTARATYLETQGWKVLRYWNNDVVGNSDGVVEDIFAEMAARASTTPGPSLAGRGAGRGDTRARPHYGTRIISGDPTCAHPAAPPIRCGRSPSNRASPNMPRAPS